MTPPHYHFLIFFANFGAPFLVLLSKNTIFAHENSLFSIFSIQYAPLFLKKITMASRRQTREYLLQYLYAESYSGAFDAPAYDEALFSGAKSIDRDDAYFQTMYDVIHAHEATLMAVIAALAPKFDLATMPRLHIAILMIALAEMLYWQ